MECPLLLLLTVYMQQDIGFAGELDALAVFVNEAVTVVGQLGDECIFHRCGGHIPGVNDINFEASSFCQTWPATALGGEVEGPFLGFLTAEIDEVLIGTGAGCLIIPTLIGQTDGVGQ